MAKDNGRRSEDDRPYLLHSISDFEAAKQIEGVLIQACAGLEGVRDAQDDYREFRRALIARSELKELIPSIIRANKTLASFCTFIKGHSDNWDERRRFVKSSFERIIEYLEDGLNIDELGNLSQAASNLGVADQVEAEVRPVTHSSNWTGIASAREHSERIRTFAPLALTGIETLIKAMEDARFNDPAALEALDALRDLHAAVGSLIGLMEAGKPWEQAVAAMEQHKGKLVGAISNGAQLMLVAPLIALGCAQVLSVLSGLPVSDGMLSALCAAAVGRDALLAVAKRSD